MEFQSINVNRLYGWESARRETVKCKLIFGLPETSSYTLAVQTPLRDCLWFVIDLSHNRQTQTADWKINEVNIVVKCFNRFPIPKFGVGNLLNLVKWVKKKKWNRSIISTSIVTRMQLRVSVSSLISRVEEGFPYNVLYREGSYQKGSIFTRKIYQRVGLSLYCCSTWKSRHICHFALQTDLEGLTDVCYGWNDKETSCFSDLLILKRRWIALMHVYVTQANFTTKPRFEIKNKRSFTEMNSQGSRVEKNAHAQKVQMQKILFTNEARWWNLLV